MPIRSLKLLDHHTNLMQLFSLSKLLSATEIPSYQRNWLRRCANPITQFVHKTRFNEITLYIY